MNANRWFYFMVAAALGCTGAVAVILITTVPRTNAELLADPQKPRRGTDIGFDLGTKLGVPRDEILAGGPGKNGIPALTSPKLVDVKAAGWLRPKDRVAGVVHAGQARAYPLRILVWHEVVNDTIGDQPVTVTYCPLCDSVAVFDRKTPDGIKEFGVSGLLYNSNVLMFDREGKPEGLWSQLKSQAVSGPLSGQALRAYASGEPHLFHGLILPDDGTSASSSRRSDHGEASAGGC